MPYREADARARGDESSASTGTTSEGDAAAGRYDEPHGERAEIA